MPDVTEPVEEDEVAGLELVPRDRDAVVVLVGGVVWQRDAELRVDVHHEAGAVESARRGAAPDVRHAEVLHRDPDHAAVAGRRGDGDALRRDRGCADDVVLLRLERQPARWAASCARSRCSRLDPEPLLARPLLRLQPGDLALDRRDQPLALGEPGLDTLLRRGTLADDSLLTGVRGLRAAPRGSSLRA